MKVNGKIYLEKTCKSCRRQRQQERAKIRYNTDSTFRLKKLNSSEKCRQKNQLEKNESWQKRINKIKQWKINNSDKIDHKKRHKKRWANPTYKVSKTISNQVNECIIDKNNSSVFDLLGYTVHDLIRHIENQFTEGMSWSNHSKYGWHIDHIKPVCSFNFTSKHDEDFKKCWALDNLRPLWAIDNIKKSHEDKKLRYR